MTSILINNFKNVDIILDLIDDYLFRMKAVYDDDNCKLTIDELSIDIINAHDDDVLIYNDEVDLICEDDYVALRRTILNYCIDKLDTDDTFVSILDEFSITPGNLVKKLLDKKVVIGLLFYIEIVLCKIDVNALYIGEKKTYVSKTFPTIHFPPPASRIPHSLPKPEPLKWGTDSYDNRFVVYDYSEEYKAEALIEFMNTF